MKYLFVDGNYFVLRLREIAQKSGLALEENLDPANMAASFDRLFYYDAMPTKRDGKDDEQFKREVGEKTAFLDRIRRSAKCHVRDGLSVPRGTSGASLRQKGVDIRLAVDVILHALNSNIDVASILTGDLDFFPVLQALQQTRTRGEVMYFRSSISSDLLYTADFMQELNVLDLIQWQRGQYQTEIQDQRPQNWNPQIEPIDPSVSHVIVDGINGICYVYYRPEQDMYYCRFERMGNLDKCGNAFVLSAHLARMYNYSVAPEALHAMRPSRRLEPQ